LKKSKQSPAPAVAPRLLTVKQAAAYLATSAHAIRQLQWGGVLPYLKIGKLIQFDISDLDAFVVTQKVPART
jgi:excisionase family DNA binding protein